MEIYNHLYLTN